MLDRTQRWCCASSESGSGCFASASSRSNPSLARDSPNGLTAASSRASTAPAAPRSEKTSTSGAGGRRRSEEHTSELQSLAYLVCRLLLEKKKKKTQEIEMHVSTQTITA